MKNFYLLGGLIILIGVTACSKDDYTYQQSNQVSALNIITSLTDDTDVIVAKGSYSYSYKMNTDNQVGSVGCSDLIMNNTSYGFETVEQTYQSTGYNLYFNNPHSASGNLTNATFFITPEFYYPSLFMDDKTFRNPYVVPQYVMVAQYTLDNKYRVKTFQPNTLFYGETVTKYPNSNGGMDNYYPGQGNNELPMTYLLQLDIEKNTAEVIIYNAKFAPPMPGLSEVHLQGLDVDFTGGKVKVTGKDIIPLAPEGTELTEYPGFPFNSFELVTQDDFLTECVISYTVATRFTGYFTGSYIAPTKFLN